MNRICVCCNRKYGEKPPYDDPHDTSGYCEPCLKLAKENGFDLKRMLEAVFEK